MLAVTHSAVKVVVKTLYGGDNFLWDSVMPQDFPKTVSMGAIGWGKIQFLGSNERDRSFLELC